MPRKSLFAQVLKLLTSPQREAARHRQAQPKVADYDGFGAVSDLLDVNDSGDLRYVGSGSYSFPIVGESAYQVALSALVGGRTEGGHKHECDAVLTCEADNPHDKNAVRVAIMGATVGYLSRSHAREWRKALSEAGESRAPVIVRALITGGWTKARRKRSASEGSFGVTLDLDYDGPD